MATFGIFDPAYLDGVVENFTKTITRKNTDDAAVLRPEYSLMTGFIGTASIGEALSDHGRTDLAYKLLQNESYPSWLYPVKNGATTIWERLNSYTIEKGFGGYNSMNSFNHYAFGAIKAWMYNYSLGIQRDPDCPGFSHFMLKPMPDPSGEMTWTRGHYDSMYGRIRSEWKIEGKGVRYQFSIPANTKATPYLLAQKLSKVREGELKVKKSQGIGVIKDGDGWVVLKLEPGEYVFFVKG